MSEPASTVLFLCSGNYYRSRFAEGLFNWLAPRQGLPWRAESRGFRLHPANIGPISYHAVEGLLGRGIATPEPHRYPLVVEEHDFHAFDLVVAVKEAEHRPKMQVLKLRYFNRFSCCGPEFWWYGVGEEALEFGDAALGF